MAKRVHPSAQEVRDLLDDLETGIEKLRVAYDKYFSGVERVAPSQLDDRIHRLLRECEKTRPSQTALRYRLNGLRARLVTYGYYWKRVLRQIEDGTYHRHRQRAARRQRQLAAMQAVRETESSTAEAHARPPGDDLEARLNQAYEDEGALPKATPPPAPPAGTVPMAKPRKPGPPPPPPTVPGMDPRSVRALYEELVSAKKAAGEDTAGLTYRSLCKQLARDAPKLRKRHGNVTFEVAKDGGKVRLRAKVGG